MLGASIIELFPLMWLLDALTFAYLMSLHPLPHCLGEALSHCRCRVGSVSEYGHCDPSSRRWWRSLRSVNMKRMMSARVHVHVHCIILIEVLAVPSFHSSSEGVAAPLLTSGSVAACASTDTTHVHTAHS